MRTECLDWAPVLCVVCADITGTVYILCKCVRLGSVLCCAVLCIVCADIAGTVYILCNALDWALCSVVQCCALCMQTLLEQLHTLQCVRLGSVLCSAVHCVCRHYWNSLHTLQCVRLGSVQCCALCMQTLLEQFTYFAMRYIPSLLVCLVCHAANLVTFCSLSKAPPVAVVNASAPSDDAVTCHLLFGAVWVSLIIYYSCDDDNGDAFTRHR